VRPEASPAGTSTAYPMFCPGRAARCSLRLAGKPKPGPSSSPSSRTCPRATGRRPPSRIQPAHQRSTHRGKTRRPDRRPAKHASNPRPLCLDLTANGHAPAETSCGSTNDAAPPAGPSDGNRPCSGARAAGGSLRPLGRTQACPYLPRECTLRHAGAARTVNWT